MGYFHLLLVCTKWPLSIKMVKWMSEFQFLKAYLFSISKKKKKVLYAGVDVSDSTHMVL